jgi:hypothetical protein
MAEWIMCEDRQPEVGAIVVVQARHTGQSFVGRRTAGEHYEDGDSFYDLTGVHYKWRPVRPRPSRGPGLPVAENEGDTITNDRGARQSKVVHAMDEIPPDVLLKVAAVLHAGREATAPSRIS